MHTVLNQVSTKCWIISLIVRGEARKSDMNIIFLLFILFYFLWQSTVLQQHTEPFIYKIYNHNKIFFFLPQNSLVQEPPVNSLVSLVPYYLLFPIKNCYWRPGGTSVSQLLSIMSDITIQTVSMKILKPRI